MMDIKVVGPWQSQFKAFTRHLDDVAESFVEYGPDLQNSMAEIVAEQYRRFLRAGVAPENAPLTRILTGVHPPLSGLADHVIVVPPESVNFGGGSLEEPTYVTYDSEEWVRYAFMHDRGYTMRLDDQQRKAIFAAAAEKDPKMSFLTGQANSQGYWMVPARPHIHMLGASTAQHEAHLASEEFVAAVLGDDTGGDGVGPGLGSGLELGAEGGMSIGFNPGGLPDHSKPIGTVAPTKSPRPPGTTVIRRPRKDSLK